MTNDLPAVISASVPAQGSAADLLPMPAGTALPAPWLTLASPLMPVVGRGAARALAASWECPADVPPMVREVARVAVHVAAAVAQDEALPPEVRITAVREAREIFRLVSGAYERAAERRAGLLVSVARVLGLTAFWGLLFRLAEARR